MNEHKSSAGKGGMGFLGVLQIVFIVLKLCKLIKWSWPVVLIPLWIEIAWIVLVLLLKAILKFRRSNAKDSDLRDAVIDEIADVQIMLTQLGIIFNCVEEVNERIDFKIDRQIGRIKEREAKRDVC